MGAIANTSLGRLEGRERRGVQVFRGVQYAQAPRGPLRWRPPLPPEPWAGVREARRLGPSAPQMPPAIWLVQRTVGAMNAQSQDCLYLNVWTPGCDRARRPVMVWIHGGAFVLGSGGARLYDGSSLARHGDVVVVTINYRLGAFGFLDLSGVLPGDTVANAGLRDQIAALEWVRDHIEAFGGDPENVTIFGESAGGMSVGTLLGTPAAQGLFHRAICESGAAHNASTPDQARRVAEVFLEALGASEVADLEQRKTSEILAAQRRATLELGIGHGVLPWQPSVDGDLLPAPPLDAISKGLARGVPTLVGTNRHEWRLFMLGDRKGARLDEAGLERRLCRALPGTDAFGVPLGRRAAIAYAQMTGRRLPRPRDRWEAFQSDRIFHQPAHRLAAAQNEHAPTFAYQFSWSPPGPGRQLGAAHGLEIPFVFGTLNEPALRPLLAVARQARRLSERMQRAWTAFARSGNPGHEDLPEWLVYGAPAVTLRLDRRCRLEYDPFAEGVRFWNEMEAAGREETSPDTAMTRAAPA
jgi:para-nitrobenzyl esterase